MDSPPPSLPQEEPQPPHESRATAATRRIHTHHCLCTNLLLATTYTLRSLPRRRATAAPDRAYILPCPSSKRLRAAAKRAERAQKAERALRADGAGRASSASVSASAEDSRSEDGSSSSSSEEDDDDANGGDDDGNLRDYTLLYSVGLDPGRPAVVVARADGFEKRWLLRCGRCRVVVGYQLDWGQFRGGARKGRRGDVVYVLPGGMVTTEEMERGGMVGEGDVGLGVGESG